MHYNKPTHTHMHVVNHQWKREILVTLASMNQSHMTCGLLSIDYPDCDVFYSIERKKENSVFSIDDFSEVACMVQILHFNVMAMLLKK